MSTQDERRKMDEYLDGMLGHDEQCALEATLATDPAAARLLSRMKAQRALRAAAYDSYLPTPVEAARYARETLDAAHAPVGRIGPWLEVRRLAGIAAAIAVLIGTFAIGRMSAPAPTSFVDDSVKTVFRVVYTDAEGVQRISGDLASQDDVKDYVRKLEQNGSTVVLADYIPVGHM